MVLWTQSYKTFFDIIYDEVGISLVKKMRVYTDILVQYTEECLDAGAN
jgi:hypothetical protein